MPIYAARSLSGVFLDTGVLGFATQKPGVNPNTDACQTWLRSVVVGGTTVIVPEIADYEQRREFLRTGNNASFLPVDTRSLREAARLWAVLRNAGLPTASKDALDGDAILAGQVFEWCATNGVPTSGIAVATTNVSDLSRSTDANGDALQAAL